MLHAETYVARNLSYTLDCPRSKAGPSRGVNHSKKSRTHFLKKVKKKSKKVKKKSKSQKKVIKKSKSQAKNLKVKKSRTPFFK